jgi:hypothetical protein
MSRSSVKFIAFLVAITLAGFGFGFVTFHFFGPRSQERTIHLPPVTLPVP